MKIETLRRKDMGKAICFAIIGMHFDMYLQNKMFRALYVRYFWLKEMKDATQMVAAYEGDALCGILLARFAGEPKRGISFWDNLYVYVVELLIRLFFRKSSGIYDETNKKMFSDYGRGNRTDGEIIFLAADPELKGRGVGTFLLEELERREKGKKVYLFTDSFCTWQFYERRGVRRVGEKKVTLDMGKRHVPMTCLLYAKSL